MPRVLIAERSGVPIGFASWRPIYDYLFGVRGGDVLWLFVQPAYRGRGVAAMLLARACADVLRDGGKFLWGGYQDPGAGRLYERMVITRPDTAVGLPAEGVELLASLAGRPPREIARALRSSRITS